MLKRVLAWIALLFFIVIVVNILFVHVYVMESVTVFMIYTLVFIFGTRINLFQTSSVQGPAEDAPEAPLEAEDTEQEIQENTQSIVSESESDPDGPHQ